MKKTLVLILLSFSISGFCIEGKWNIVGVSVDIIKKDDAYISKNCQKKCEALEATKLIHKKILQRSSLSGGKNPGSVICKIIGGEVLIGLDKNKNQNTFCFFKKDESLISSGSISAIFYNLK